MWHARQGIGTRCRSRRQSVRAVPSHAGLIICALRSYDAEHSQEMAALVASFRGDGVLGVNQRRDEKRVSIAAVQ